MQNDKRLIDANTLEKDMRAYADRKRFDGHIETACGVLSAICRIDEAPTIDAVEVVRCRECKHSVCIFKAQFVGCDMWRQSTPKDGFCHMGAKMGGGAVDVR